MPLVPIAAFLAGALLTLLLPVALLIALVIWYWMFSVRVPDTADGSAPGSGAGAANPAAGAANPAPGAANPAPSAPSEAEAPAQDV